MGHLVEGTELFGGLARMVVMVVNQFVQGDQQGGRDEQQCEKTSKSPHPFPLFLKRILTQVAWCLLWLRYHYKKLKEFWMLKHFFPLVLTLSLSLSAQINKQELNKLDVEALIIKDLTAKQTLYAKEPFKEVQPASLTKVMTVILAIERGRLNEPVTITREMTRVEPTIAGYRRGDVIRLEDLIKAAMIKSDNDAAKAIAITVGGSEEQFVKMMNAKARAIGMNATQFTNPCGYDTKGHYSTPKDLLKMAEYAIKNRKFNEISKMNEHRYKALNKNREFYAYTHNRLLNRYQYAVGIKTGYTAKAGPCLIARAKKDGKDCVIVMMNAKGDRWKTAKNIFEQVLNS